MTFLEPPWCGLQVNSLIRREGEFVGLLRSFAGSPKSFTTGDTGCTTCGDATKSQNLLPRSTQGITREKRNLNRRDRRGFAEFAERKKHTADDLTQVPSTPSRSFARGNCGQGDGAAIRQPKFLMESEDWRRIHSWNPPAEGPPSAACRGDRTLSSYSRRVRGPVLACPPRRRRFCRRLR